MIAADTPGTPGASGGRAQPSGGVAVEDRSQFVAAIMEAKEHGGIDVSNPESMQTDAEILMDPEAIPETNPASNLPKRRSTRLATNPDIIDRYLNMIQTESDIETVRVAGSTREPSAEAIDACLALFLNYDTVTDVDRKAALTQLKTFSREDGGRELLFQTGIVPQLVAMMVDLGTIDVLAALVVNLGYSNHPHDKIIKTLLASGVISKLVWTLECRAPLTVRSALNAMVNLGIGHEDNKDRICTTPNFPQQLVRCLQHCESTVRLSASRLLHSLCCREKKISIDRVQLLAEAGLAEALAAEFKLSNLEFVNSVLPIVYHILNSGVMSFYGKFAESGGVEAVHRLISGCTNGFGMAKAPHERTVLTLRTMLEAMKALKRAAKLVGTSTATPGLKRGRSADRSNIEPTSEAEASMQAEATDSAASFSAQLAIGSQQDSGGPSPLSRVKEMIEAVAGTPHKVPGYMAIKRALITEFGQERVLAARDDVQSLLNDHYLQNFTPFSETIEGRTAAAIKIQVFVRQYFARKELARRYARHSIRVDAATLIQTNVRDFLLRATLRASPVADLLEAETEALALNMIHVSTMIKQLGDSTEISPVPRSDAIGSTASRQVDTEAEETTIASDITEEVVGDALGAVATETFASVAEEASPDAPHNAVAPERAGATGDEDFDGTGSLELQISALALNMIHVKAMIDGLPTSTDASVPLKAEVEELHAVQQASTAATEASRRAEMAEAEKVEADIVAHQAALAAAAKEERIRTEIQEAKVAQMAMLHAREVADKADQLRLEIEATKAAETAAAEAVMVNMKAQADAVVEAARLEREAAAEKVAQLELRLEAEATAARLQAEEHRQEEVRRSEFVATAEATAEAAAQAKVEAANAEARVVIEAAEGKARETERHLREQAEQDRATVEEVTTRYSALEAQMESDGAERRDSAATMLAMQVARESQMAASEAEKQQAVDAHATARRESDATARKLAKLETQLAAMLAANAHANATELADYTETTQPDGAQVPTESSTTNDGASPNPMQPPSQNLNAPPLDVARKFSPPSTSAAVTATLGVALTSPRRQNTPPTSTAATPSPHKRSTKSALSSPASTVPNAVERAQAVKAWEANKAKAAKAAKEEAKLAAKAAGKAAKSAKKMTKSKKVKSLTKKISSV
eukprot:m.314173 g.314173  ORF g.314173 m.314173 type:complete len:1163 (-) comp27495_c0_seq2:110-3598(-)